MGGRGLYEVYWGGFIRVYWWGLPMRVYWGGGRPIRVYGGGLIRFFLFFLWILFCCLFFLLLLHPLYFLPPPPHRFEGQERWLCADRRGRWSPEVLQFEHTPVVAVDLRGSQLTYDGLDNLGMGVSLPPPEHRDGAGGLSVTPLRAGIWMGPPTVGGAVKCVPPPPRKLQYLDVGGLSVPSPGLLRILLEEMLPHCQVVGMDMGDVGDMGEGDPTETPPRDSAVMGGGVEVALNALRSLCCV
uniref:Uncharacterized protein n=1 Tax=Coturnix japonica TaxID=93934 RepID=A0A8C2SS15_COTJA